MKYNIYSVRDALNGFGPLMLDTNDASAMRGFRASFSNSESIMYHSPKDYDLYKLGTFDTSDGELECYLPILVVSGLSIKEVN